MFAFPSLAAIKTQEPRALKHLFHWGMRKLHHLFPESRKGEGYKDAEDTVQESIYALWQMIQKKPDFSAHLRPYFTRMLRNEWVRQQQLKQKQQQVPTMELTETIAAVAQEDSESLRERFLRVERGLAELLRRNQAACVELLRLTYLSGEPDRTLAKMLELSINYLKVKRHRCMERLRDILAAQPTN